MQLMHLVQLKHVSIFEQLQLEEALLRADQKNWCLINWGSPPAIVLGISSKPHELIHLDNLKEKNIPLIRRFSGGGTVFVDLNTCFITFICNASTLPIPPFPEKIMRWTEAFYTPLFAPHPFRLIENDYVVGERKCGGNAQSICKQRWLHHSSFLWDYCPVQMNYLKIPSKAPLYRAQRPHSDFLCRLKDYWQNQEAFHQHFLQRLSLQFEVIEKNFEDICRVKEQPHRKATTILLPVQMADLDWKENRINA